MTRKDNTVGVRFLVSDIRKMIFKTCSVARNIKNQKKRPKSSGRFSFLS